ncbi:MAG: DUF1573 domain-containing protein [Alistipes sp.]|nr:DUF1573 domain-containing protein [Alistipes sp.]
MVRGVVILLWLLVSALGAECRAQIKIIPQSVLDSVANPKTVTGARMVVEGGDVVLFGCISEDSAAWRKVIVWRNGGDKPLTITSVRTSCSCLKAEAERKVVKGGEKATIAVAYYPKGHPGKVEQRIYIYTNLSDTTPTAVVKVRGEVQPSADRRGDYPFYRGALRLRQDTVVLDGDRRQEVRIACLNSSERAMRLSADTLLSSAGITLRSEPAVLQGGAEGDLVVTYTPRAEKQEKGLNLYIKGLALPLRERLIRVKFKDIK